MQILSKPIAGMLLLGFLGVNIFVTLCVMGAPGMPTCPMPMEDFERPALGSNHDCCLACVESATLPTNVGLSAPIGLAILPSSNPVSFSNEIPAFEFDEELPLVLATVSPPVFLLNSTFLI